jgi:large subunit ribosomal protein L29
MGVLPRRTPREFETEVLSSFPLGSLASVANSLWMDAVMSKPAELREQSDEQLNLLLAETQQNLFRLRLQSETERLEAPSEIIKAKREIARIKTILRLRELDRQRSIAAATPTP